MAEQTLFGSYNPALIQQAIDAERERNLLEQAKLTPQQITLLGAARSGQQLGSALGGVVGNLFGTTPVQDPRLQQAQLGQQAYQEALDASGGDASSPAFFKKLSSSAAKLGVTTLAQQAAQQAAKLEAEQALGIQRFAAAQASLAQAAKERTPEAPLTIADRTRLNELIQQFGTNEGARRFRAERDAAERSRAGAGASKIEVMGQGNVLDIDKEDAKGYRLSRESASKALPVLTKMQSLLDSPQGIIGGTATEARTGFLKALDTLGVSTAEARKAISNTEQFNIQVRNLLQSIIKQFGYNPSNADVKFALESLPNASNSPEGLRAILNALVKANKDQLNESTRALDYFRKNKGSFEGFTPNLDIVSPGGGPKPPSQMTDEELRSEIALRRQQK
jgi:hypothetical protein